MPRSSKLYYFHGPDGKEITFHYRALQALYRDRYWLHFFLRGGSAVSVCYEHAHESQEARNRIEEWWRGACQTDTKLGQ